jgi:conjugative transfer signal peptidase TraF
MALLLVVMGLRINLTDSIPVGLYRIKAIEDVKNIKQTYVIFCPDDKPVFQQARDRGYIDYGLCPGSYGYLMKKVVATQGDKIAVTAAGVFVNQTLISFSKPTVFLIFKRLNLKYRLLFIAQNIALAFPLKLSACTVIFDVTCGNAI